MSGQDTTEVIWDVDQQTDPATARRLANRLQANTSTITYLHESGYLITAHVQQVERGANPRAVVGTAVIDLVPGQLAFRHWRRA